MRERSRLRRAIVACPIVIAVLLAGCGGDGGTASETTEPRSTLERADAALATMHSGHITLNFNAKGETSDGGTSAPVGFTLDGVFDMSASGKYPVLDLAYNRVVGSTTDAMTVLSDGSKIQVVADGQTVDVPEVKATSLEKSDDPQAGVTSDLGISGWIEQPAEAPGQPTDGVDTIDITGAPDVVDVLNDLTHLIRELTGETALKPLEGESADRVRSLARPTAAVVTVGAADAVPRHIHATLDFGGTPSKDLAVALGQFAGVALEVDLVIAQPNQPVAAPALP
jgi:hypothetical protein